ncbi:2-oxoglutarate and iron-dependent oxygenase domain-containing protein 3 [Agrilus planipennis]|uniref:2-oxoglutarate and iron-dependent oxygenase domain-containing protein 3 n=1 Tax=Agrilus planipennis TaxID=224129 RepID=A0A1W4XTA3_AGRPL|nr:2-oxoglutarate and iron-dependent oxygenase domain-containing protein 3 [Agrilus planipennis]
MTNEENQLKKRKVVHKSDKTAETVPDKNKTLGSLPTFPNQRLWSRSVLIIGLLLFIWYKSSSKNGNITLAKQSEILANKGSMFDCDADYSKEVTSYPECIPNVCGRLVTDKLITGTEADMLHKIAQRGFALGGSDGGASIFDLHSGALSFKTKFVNVLALNESKRILSPIDVSTYKLVMNKIKGAVVHAFKIDPHSLYLTKPTFFSKLTNIPPVTEHDKYWMPHVDKETYGSFHYTSLLYLSDFGMDFKGGRLTFIDKQANVTIEPRKGRVAIFTSGAENFHFVERVSEGTRYAITISFTCNKFEKNDQQILGFNL